MAFLVPHDTNPGVLAKGLVRPSPDISSRPGVTAAADMSVLPSVLGCRTLRRTVQVRLGSNLLRLPGTRRKRLRCAWHTLIHGLGTAIHETSGLKTTWHWICRNSTGTAGIL